jgi:hypothetical protein
MIVATNLERNRDGINLEVLDLENPAGRPGDQKFENFLWNYLSTMRWFPSVEIRTAEGQRLGCDSEVQGYYFHNIEVPRVRGVPMPHSVICVTSMASGSVVPLHRPQRR